MTDGFANPVTAGNILVQPAIQSPDFSIAGQTGWAIEIGGEAYFFNLALRGTFSGTDWVIGPAGAFFYAGAPAANTLLASVANAPGTDPFGNTYLPGMVSYAQAPATSAWVAAQLYDGNLQYWICAGNQSGAYSQTAAIINPASAASDALVIESATTVQIVSAADSNTYDTASLIITILGDQLIQSTSPVTVAGGISGVLSAPVAAGTYHFRFFLMLVATASAGAPGIFVLEGPALSSTSYMYDFLASSALNAAGPGSGGGVQVAEVYFNTTLNQEMQVPAGTMETGQSYRTVIEGEATFTAAGTLLIRASSTVNADTYDIKSGSFLELQPVTGITGTGGLPGLTGTPDWANVLTYGADPTGAADSTTAFQDAWNAAGFAYVPEGKYKINAATLNPPKAYNYIQGDGWNSQILFDGTLNTPLIGMADTTQRRVFIRDVRITQTNAASAGVAISGNYFVDSALERILIDGLTAAPNGGIIFAEPGSYYNKIRDCRVSAGGAGGRCVSFDNGANSNAVEGLTRLIGDANTTGVYANANGLTIDHIDMESAGLCGIEVGPAGLNVTIRDPYVQTLTTPIQLDSGCGPVQIQGGDADGSTNNLTDLGCTALTVQGFRDSGGAILSYMSGGNKTLGFAGAGLAPDVWLYRIAAATVAVSGGLDVTGNARYGQLLEIVPSLSTLGTGLPTGIEIANAAHGPAGTPAGGGGLYASAGALYWIGSSGTITEIAPA